jgi:hypothetical protein
LRLVALSGDLSLDELRAANAAREELDAVMTGKRTADEDEVETLLRSARASHTTVGVFIEVPPAAP